MATPNIHTRLEASLKKLSFRDTSYYTGEDGTFKLFTEDKSRRDKENEVQGLTIPKDCLIILEIYEELEEIKSAIPEIVKLCSFHTELHLYDKRYCHYYFKYDDSIPEIEKHSTPFLKFLTHKSELCIPKPFTTLKWLESLVKSDFDQETLVAPFFTNTNSIFQNDATAVLNLSHVNVEDLKAHIGRKVVTLENFSPVDILNLSTGKTTEDLGREVLNVIGYLILNKFTKRQVLSFMNKVPNIQNILKTNFNGQSLEELLKVKYEINVSGSSFREAVLSYNKMSAKQLIESGEMYTENNKTPASMFNIEKMLENSLIFQNKVYSNDRNSEQILIEERLPGITTGNRKSAFFYTDDDRIVNKCFSVLYMEFFGKQSKYQEIKSNSQMYYTELKEDDPFKRYIKKLKWDGVERLNTWLPTVLRCTKKNTDDYRYLSELGKLMIQCIVWRTLVKNDDPSVVFDYLPTFIGNEGTGKTLLAQQIALDELFYGIINKIDDKELYRFMVAKSVIDLPEGTTSHGKKDQDTLKAILSMKSFTHRKHFKNGLQESRVRNIWVANANEYPNLESESQRRICVVNVNEAFDSAYLKAYIRLIYAETVRLYESQKANGTLNYVLHLSKESEKHKAAKIKTKTRDAIAGNLVQTLEKFEEINFNTPEYMEHTYKTGTLTLRILLKKYSAYMDIDKKTLETAFIGMGFKTENARGRYSVTFEIKTPDVNEAIRDFVTELDRKFIR